MQTCLLHNLKVNMGLEIPFLLGLQAAAAGVAAAIFLRIVVFGLDQLSPPYPTRLSWLIPGHKVEWILAAVIGAFSALCAGVPPVVGLLTIAGISGLLVSMILSLNIRSLASPTRRLALGTIAALFATGALPLAPTAALLCGFVVSTAYNIIVFSSSGTRKILVNELIAIVSVVGSFLIWRFMGFSVLLPVTVVLLVVRCLDALANYTLSFIALLIIMVLEYGPQAKHACGRKLSVVSRGISQKREAVIWFGIAALFASVLSLIIYTYISAASDSTPEAEVHGPPLAFPLIVFTITALCTLCGVKTVKPSWEMSLCFLLLVGLPVLGAIIDVICLASHAIVHA